MNEAFNIEAAVREEGFRFLSVTHHNGTEVTFVCPCGNVERAFTRRAFSEDQFRGALRQHYNEVKARGREEAPEKRERVN